MTGSRAIEVLVIRVNVALRREEATSVTYCRECRIPSQKPVVWILFAVVQLSATWPF